MNNLPRLTKVLCRASTILVFAGLAGCSGSGGASGSGGTGDGGSTKDSGGAPVTYPPLALSAIGAAAPIESDFYFTEGPVWDPKKGVLYFLDINAHQGGATGGAIYRLTLPSAVDVLLEPVGNAAGLALDPHGNIVAAGGGSRSAWRLSASSTMETLAPCSQGGGTCYSGQEINTPNDITVRSDGVVYFTDPTFGGNGSQGFPMLTLPLANAQGVYRVTADGVLHLEDSTASGPNGVNLSPDEKTLYVSYSISGQIAKFDVAADGSLGNKTTFATTGATIADGMCVDAGGNVYVGTINGLMVFDPTGTPLGIILVGGQITTNCAFGGPDQTTLFITARTQATQVGTPPMGGGSLYQIADMPVPGIPGQN
jgi:gluconolactonase